MCDILKYYLSLECMDDDTVDGDPLSEDNDEVLLKTYKMETVTCVDIQNRKERQQLSIKYNGVDVYESCIETLEPHEFLNDTIVTVLIE